MELTTERLRLAPFEPLEAAELHALWTRPEVRRYLWDDEVIAEEQTEGIITTSGQLFAAHGYGLWSVRERDAPELLGFGGFWHFRDPPELELILGLAGTAWGRGYATEAGLALIHYGFSMLGFDDIRGSTDLLNKSSQRLMERLGMHYERRAVVAGLETLFYTVGRNG